MSIFQGAILGAIQALTEFLPISSSGHLILAAHFLGGHPNPLVFDVVLHLGTALALLVVFWRDLFSIVKSIFVDFFAKRTNFAQYSANSLLGIFIALACIPAIIAGLLLGDYIEQNLRTVGFVIIFSLFGTLLMILAELAVRVKMSTETVTLKNSLTVGALQVLALFPGFSRSGATISGGMLSGLTRESAARFSFLLSIPLVVAAGIFEISKAFYSYGHMSMFTLLAGFLTSFLLGIFVIKFLLKFLAKHSLWVFIVYRILLVSVLLLTTWR